jgi:hypothetical protein
MDSVEPGCRALEISVRPPRAAGVVRARSRRQLVRREADPHVLAELADAFLGAGVVVAGADEPAAVVVIDGDLVDAAGEPGQDAAGFGELIAEVGGDVRRGG